MEYLFESLEQEARFLDSHIDGDMGDIKYSSKEDALKLRANIKYYTIEKKKILKSIKLVKQLMELSK